MNAVELVRDRKTREPAKDETSAISKYCYEHGLITISAGTYGNILRTLMPLTITGNELTAHRLAQIDDENSFLAGIVSGVQDVVEAEDLDMQTSLFEGLAHGRLRRGLVVLLVTGG